MSDRSYRIAESDRLERIIRNPVEEAIFDVLGGIPNAAKALGCARGAVYYLVDAWPLTDRRTAVSLDEATTKAGCRVPAGELLGLKDHPWQGPERHEEGARRRNGKRKGLRRVSSNEDLLNPAQPSARLRVRLVGGIAASR